MQEKSIIIIIIIIIIKEYPNTSYHDNQRNAGLENNILINQMYQWW